MNRFQQKIFAILGCYLSDITLTAWLYYRSTNYGQYNEAIGQKLDSPDFQLQFYRLFLQSLTFTLLLFVIAHAVVYILAWKNFRSAFFYLKYFCVMGFAASLFVIYDNSGFAILPTIFYLFGYYVFAKEFKLSTAAMRSSPQ